MVHAYFSSGGVIFGMEIETQCEIETQLTIED